MSIDFTVITNLDGTKYCNYDYYILIHKEVEGDEEYYAPEDEFNAVHLRRYSLTQTVTTSVEVEFNLQDIVFKFASSLLHVPELSVDFITRDDRIVPFESNTTPSSSSWSRILVRHRPRVNKRLFDLFGFVCIMHLTNGDVLPVVEFKPKNYFIKVADNSSGLNSKFVPLNCPYGNAYVFNAKCSEWKYCMHMPISIYDEKYRVVDTVALKDALNFYTTNGSLEDRYVVEHGDYWRQKKDIRIEENRSKSLVIKELLLEVDRLKGREKYLYDKCCELAGKNEC